MPDLTIQVQEIKGLQGTALVILSGTIDTNSVITFQTKLNTVRESGITRFILDLEGVKYVNSTGLGYLINLQDSIQGGKGGIALVKVQPKVKLVFDMLGLDKFFKIHQTRDEALRHFTQEPMASPTDQTVVLKSQQLPGSVKSTTPPNTPAPAHPTGHSVPAVPDPAPRLAAHAGEQGSDLLHIECQSCRALLAVKDPGTYKCPRCFALFNYLGAGKASFLPRRKAMPVQLSLNFTEECTTGLLEFVKVVAQRAGFHEGTVGEVLSAVKDTVGTIRRYAYGNNDNNIYHVMMVTTDSELELRFADYGQSVNSGRVDDQGRPLFQTARDLMDKCEIRHHPKGGNVLTLSKKVK